MRVHGDVAQRQVPLIEVNGEVLVHTRARVGDAHPLRSHHGFHELGPVRYRIFILIVLIRGGLDVEELEDDVDVVRGGVLVELGVGARVRGVAIVLFVIFVVFIAHVKIDGKDELREVLDAEFLARPLDLEGPRGVPRFVFVVGGI